MGGLLIGLWITRGFWALVIIILAVAIIRLQTHQALNHWVLFNLQKGELTVEHRRYLIDELRFRVGICPSFNQLMFFVLQLCRFSRIEHDKHIFGRVRCRLVSKTFSPVLVKDIGKGDYWLGLRQLWHVLNEFFAELFLFFGLFKKRHIWRVIKAAELLVACLVFKLYLTFLSSLLILNETVSQAILQLLQCLWPLRLSWIFVNCKRWCCNSLICCPVSSNRLILIGGHFIQILKLMQISLIILVPIVWIRIANLLSQQIDPVITTSHCWQINKIVGCLSGHHPQIPIED